MKLNSHSAIDENFLPFMEPDVSFTRLDIPPLIPILSQVGTFHIVKALFFCELFAYYLLSYVWLSVFCFTDFRSVLFMILPMRAISFAYLTTFSLITLMSSPTLKYLLLNFERICKEEPYKIL